MVRLLHNGVYAFWKLDPVVKWRNSHREDLLDRRGVVMGFTVETAEGQVATDHPEGAPGADSVGDGDQGVAAALAGNKRSRSQQKSVRSYIGKHNQVEGRQVVGPMKRDKMTGEMDKFVASVLDRCLQPLRTFLVAGVGVVIEALYLYRVMEPRLAYEENASH